MDTKKNTSAATQPNVTQKVSTTPVMQSFDSAKKSPQAGMVVFILIVMIALGVGSGYALATFSGGSGSSIMPSALNPNSVQKGQTYGSADTATFKDTAEGTLKVGGIDDEGQFHLERPGGDSQNVYLTSSTLDLSKFNGRKVKVWGATQTAKKAGWLMDVGKVEVE